MKQKEKEFVESFNLSEKLQDVIFDFIDMRTMIKKPMTERAIKMLINKLDKLAQNDDEKVAIVEQSIYHNWQDVYALVRDDYMARKEEQKEKWITIE